MAQLNDLIVTGNSRFLNPINGNARNGVYYVKGTQTGVTGSWTGNIPVPALYDGLTIMYYLPYAGSGNATLNLTLSDGTTTGAKNCYYNTSRLTTHYGAGCNILMTYHPAGSITSGGSAITDDRWITDANYDSDYILPYSWTAPGTAEKYISGSYLYADLTKTWFMFNLIYANTYAGALKLNVNGNGAKPLYINGTVSSSSNYTMPRGTYLVYYDGTNYYVRTDGKITGDLTGNAATATYATSAGSATDSTKLPLAGGTMTGQIKTSFKSSIATGSQQADASTIPNLCNELRYSSGVMGSVSISTSYTKDGVTIPTAWYNFLWIPHRSGGVNGQASRDNCDYGSLYLSGMTTSGCYMLRFASGNIAELKNLYSATDSTKMPLAGGTFTGIVTHNKSIHGSGGDTIYGSEARNSKWYKLTLATNGLTPPSSSNQWYMCSFTLNMAGDYGDTPKGSIYVSYYIYWNKSTFSADKVFATAFGNNMDRVKIYYKLTNPFILYIDSSNAYSAIWIDKISYRDSGDGYRTLDTVLETTSAITTSEYSSIPIACFYTYDGSQLYTNKSLLPNGNNALNLGASDKKWANGYFTNINGVAVGDSPKFTDNNTTYTFANGTNGFTVTPSGGSAQTVTVTPSISNNVTGSGTSGYLTKFNGANTITNGPALGSSTTTYLRNDGSWQTPPNDNNAVTQTDTSTYGPYKVLLSGTADNTTRTEGARKSSNLQFNPAISNGASIGYEFKDGTRGDWTTDQTCGLLDIAGSSSFNVRLCGDGTVAAEKIICHSMYTYDISSQYTFSKSSGNWTISTIEAHRTGNVVNLAVTFKGNGSAVSAGGNGFVGTCTAGPLPVMVARGTSFLSSGGIVFQLDIAGNVYVRVIGSSVTLASTGTNTISTVFMVND